MLHPTSPTPSSLHTYYVGPPTAPPPQIFQAVLLESLVAAGASWAPLQRLVSGLLRSKPQLEAVLLEVAKAKGE